LSPFAAHDEVEPSEMVGETYPIEVVGIGCKPLNGPETLEPRS
jgi:hypothetical protein